jgi:hypothetical protein
MMAPRIGRRGELTTSQLKTLQTRTFYGKEKKSLTYVIAIPFIAGSAASM